MRGIGIEPLIYVIIVSYNGKDCVLRLLASIYQSTYPNYSIMLVDNNSVDKTIDEVRLRFPSCQIVENSTNKGFGTACNIGIEFAITGGAELALVLNQDTIIGEEMLNNLATFSLTHPKAACIGPKTYTWSSESGRTNRFLYAGALRKRLPLMQKVFGIGKLDIGQYDSKCQVDYVWGHGMFLRVEALKKIGGFDPAIFMYYEDLDLCIRLKLAGYEIWYDPSSVMWHDIPDGARASVSELWRWMLKTDSISILHRKHAGFRKGIFLDIMTFIVEEYELLRTGYLRAATHRLLAFLHLLKHSLGLAISTQTSKLYT